ncbi:MAG: LamG-like jellyroll fold domain-containing protein [Phycisphaerales bacterium]
MSKSQGTLRRNTRMSAESCRFEMLETRCLMSSVVIDADAAMSQSGGDDLAVMRELYRGAGYPESNGGLGATWDYCEQIGMNRLRSINGERGGTLDANGDFIAASRLIEHLNAATDKGLIPHVVVGQQAPTNTVGGLELPANPGDNWGATEWATYSDYAYKCIDWMLNVHSFNGVTGCDTLYLEVGNEWAFSGEPWTMPTNANWNVYSGDRFDAYMKVYDAWQDAADRVATDNPGKQILVGGGNCNYGWARNFIDRCVSQGYRMDWVTMHLYVDQMNSLQESTVYEPIRLVQDKLDLVNRSDTLIGITEWGPSATSGDSVMGHYNYGYEGGAAAMTLLQSAMAAGADVADYLLVRDNSGAAVTGDPTGISYTHLYNNVNFPKPAYNAMTMVNMLPGTRISSVAELGEPYVHSIASADSQSAGLIVYNYGMQYDWVHQDYIDLTTSQDITPRLRDLPFGGAVTVSRYLIDSTHSNIAAQLDAGQAPTLAGSQLTLVDQFAATVTNGSLDLPTVVMESSAVSMWIVTTGQTPAAISPAAAQNVTGASFVGFDRTTQGTYTGVYAGDGYHVLADWNLAPEPVASIPSSVVMSRTVDTMSPYRWAANPTDVRALQVSPGSASRVATAWMSSTSFDINLNFTDGQQHQFAMYAVDWNRQNVVQRYDVLDAATGATLDSRTLSNFGNGAWTVWNLQGDVTIRVTAISGSAVVTGYAFDPIRAASGATVEYLGFEDGTSGSVMTSSEASINAPQLNVTSSFGNPRFAADVPGQVIRDGLNGAILNDDNQLSVQLFNNSGGVMVRNDDLMHAENFTIEFFAKLSAGADWGRIVSYVGDSGYGWGTTAWSISLGGSSGTAQVTMDTTTWDGKRYGETASLPGYNQYVGTNAQLLDDTWHHVALTYDYNSPQTEQGTLRVFVDYAQVGSRSVNLTPYYGDYAAYAMYVGNHVTGYIDEVRFSDTALVPDQFLRAEAVPAAMASPNVAYWNLEDGVADQPLVASESQVNSPNVDVLDSTGGVTFAAQTPGAIIRDGLNGAILDDDNTLSARFVNNTGSLIVANDSLLHTQNYTVEFFAKLSAGSSWGTIMSLQNPSQFAWQVGLGGDAGTLFARIDTTTWNGLRDGVEAPLPGYNQYLNGGSGSQLLDDNWHHVALTYAYDDPATLHGTARLYYDYNQVATRTINLDPYYGDGYSYKMNIGTHVTGYIDEVRFSDAALTTGQFLRAEAAPAQPATSAQFIQTDTGTQGTFGDIYGADGWNVANGTSSIPSYATASMTGQSSTVWQQSTTDARGIQTTPGSFDRTYAAWYSNTSFNINLNFTDGQTHQFALYAMDDSWGRSQRYDVYDADTNELLDSRTLSGFHYGTWSTWNLKGNIRIQVTALSGSAVVSGFAFDSAA